MKLFGRTGGYYLFWTGFVYFVTGVICAIWFKEIPVHLLTMTWICVLMVPLVIPPIGRYFNLQSLFGENKVDKNSDDKVVKFPEAKPELKLVQPKEPEMNVERPPYTLGRNDAGNIQFSMKNDYGSTSLTMTDQGVVELIEDLAHYIRQTHNVEITTKE